MEVGYERICKGVSGDPRPNAYTLPTVFSRGFLSEVRRVTYDSSKEAKGAWIIHHGRKLMLDVHGPAEFPAIDVAAKTATLLAKLGQANQIRIPMMEVRAVATASGLNPLELMGLLQMLETKRLVERSTDEISVLGVNIASSLAHAADIYEDAGPKQFERASISLAEIASTAPVHRKDASEQIGDLHHLTSEDVSDFLNRAEHIGFVDKEGDGDDCLLFNGNLFRRESVVKIQKVLASLDTEAEKAIRQIDQELSTNGCLKFSYVEKVLSEALTKNLVEAGVYDLNQVRNESGIHGYITSPAAFHKFVDPMVDDCFDMAKSLVAALTYGMLSRPADQGRITMLPALLRKLISDEEVGPATAIGRDYRVLEVEHVVRLRQHPKNSNMFFMKLLKREIGELALHVLTQGDAHEQSLIHLPGAPMSGYEGPESSRVSLRRKQNPVSKRTTRDLLEAVRGGHFS